MENHPRTGRSRLIGVTIIALLFVAVSACGDEERRDYTVPQALCGTPVDAEELTPFLPSGNKISVRKRPRSFVRLCDVVIDSKLVVITTQEWLEKGRTTRYFARGQTLENPNRSARNGRLLYSDREAFIKTQGCVDSRTGQELYVAVQASGSRHKDAEAMKRLVVSFAKEVENSSACTAGPEQYGEAGSTPRLRAAQLAFRSRYAAYVNVHK